MDFSMERYPLSFLVTLSVYSLLLLLVFMPFLPLAAGLGLFSEPFMLVIMVLNVLPLPLLALYILQRIDGRPARFSLMASQLAASFLVAFFVLPLQL